MAPFNYAEFTTRNIGFVSAAEQERLRQSCVFVVRHRRHGRRGAHGPGARRRRPADRRRHRRVRDLQPQSPAVRLHRHGRPPEGRGRRRSRPPHQSGARDRGARPRMARRHRADRRARAGHRQRHRRSRRGPAALSHRAGAAPAGHRRLCVAAALRLCHARRRGDAGGAARLSDDRQGLERGDQAGSRGGVPVRDHARAGAFLLAPSHRSRGGRRGRGRDAAAACRSPRW